MSRFASRAGQIFLLTALCVASSAVLPARAAPPQETAGQAKEQERPLPPHVALALDSRDYPAAARALEDFLFDNTGHREAMFQLAFCYGTLGRKDEAESLYRELLTLEPRNYAARINLGVLLVEAEKVTKAVVEFRHAVEAAPDDLRARLYLATALEDAGESQEALAQYARAVELDPGSNDARRGAARVIAAGNDLVRSAPLLDRLLGLAPTDLALVELRATSLQLQGKYAEVPGLYDNYFAAAAKDSELPPADLARAHYQAGLIAHGLKQYERALAHHTRAGELGGKEFEYASVTGRARALGALERYQEAAPLYRRGIESMGHDVDLDFVAEYGYVLIKTREYAGAARVLSEVVRVDPSREDPFNQLIFALHRLENHAAALEALNRRAGHHRETPDTLFLRGLSHDRLQQCVEALEYYEKFLEANQGAENAYYFQASGRRRALKRTCKESH